MKTDGCSGAPVVGVLSGGQVPDLCPSCLSVPCLASVTT